MINSRAPLHLPQPSLITIILNFASHLWNASKITVVTMWPKLDFAISEQSKKPATRMKNHAMAPKVIAGFGITNVVGKIAVHWNAQKSFLLPFRSHSRFKSRQSRSTPRQISTLRVWRARSTWAFVWGLTSFGRLQLTWWNSRSNVNIAVMKNTSDYLLQLQKTNLTPKLSSNTILTVFNVKKWTRKVLKWLRSKVDHEDSLIRDRAWLPSCLQSRSYYIKVTVSMTFKHLLACSMQSSKFHWQLPAISLLWQFVFEDNTATYKINFVTFTLLACFDLTTAINEALNIY